jgi:hypothetical protein
MPPTIGENTPFDVISILPPVMKGISLKEQMHLKVALDRDFVLSDVAKNASMAVEVCTLVNEQDASNVVKPVATKIDNGVLLNAMFNFARPDSNAKGGTCYNLRCSTRNSLPNKPELINMLPGLKTRYCVDSEQEF